MVEFSDRHKKKNNIFWSFYKLQAQDSPDHWCKIFFFFVRKRANSTYRSIENLLLGLMMSAVSMQGVQVQPAVTQIASLSACYRESESAERLVLVNPPSLP